MLQEEEVLTPRRWNSSIISPSSPIKSTFPALQSPIMEQLVQVGAFQTQLISWCRNPSQMGGKNPLRFQVGSGTTINRCIVVEQRSLILSFQRWIGLNWKILAHELTVTIGSPVSYALTSFDLVSLFIGSAWPSICRRISVGRRMDFVWPYRSILL